MSMRASEPGRLFVLSLVTWSKAGASLDSGRWGLSRAAVCEALLSSLLQSVATCNRQLVSQSCDLASLELATSAVLNAPASAYNAYYYFAYAI